MKTQTNTKKKKIIIISVLSAALLIAIPVIVFTSAAASTPPKQYQTIAAFRGDIQVTITSTGTISAEKTVDVGTQVSGTISKLFADFNDHVRKGQLLAELDTTLLAISVQSATADKLKADAQYALNLKTYNNNIQLHEKNLISDLELDTSKVEKESSYASMLSAQAALTRAKANLSYAVIRSPIDGVVINRLAEEGQTVAAGNSVPTLFTIAGNLANIEIKALVPESDIGNVKTGQKVTFTVSAYNNDTFNGSVSMVHLQSTEVSNVVNYEVIIKAKNQERKLLPGMTATITFIVDERTNALLLPNSVLALRPDEAMLSEFKNDHPDQQMRNDRQRSPQSPENNGAARERPDHSGTSSANRAILWYLGADGKVNMLPVQTGITDGINTEIISDKITGEMKFLHISKTAANANRNGDAGHRPPRFF